MAGNSQIFRGTGDLALYFCIYRYGMLQGTGEFLFQDVVENPPNEGVRFAD